MLDSHPKFELKEIKIHLDAISIGFPFLGRKKYKLQLPDSSYGEWIIYQNNWPKFYFCAFKDDGEDNEITEFVQRNNLDFEEFLPLLLSSKGFNGLSMDMKGVQSNEVFKHEYDVLSIE